MDNQIVVSDYAQMDRVLREERAYILNLVKQIKKAGCNVLLIQKSILRYVSAGLLAYCGHLGNSWNCLQSWKVEVKYQQLHFLIFADTICHSHNQC